jgi:hypothetical protein
MPDCREITACRLCGGDLNVVLDLGDQCLAGQFPRPEDPDPPAYPLELLRCDGCGLVQLAHTVNPEAMFRDYWYRSGVSGTMRKHLFECVREACDVLGRNPELVLDIGGNDKTLLSYFAYYKGTSVDPARVESRYEGFRHIPDFYPTPKLAGEKFDLIFSIACFYDADDPLAFATAVRENLADDGVWCLEVANLPDMLRNLSYDAICHEHLCYYSAATLDRIFVETGLAVVGHSFNCCNGGSLRVYLKKDRYTVNNWFKTVEVAEEIGKKQIDKFAEKVTARQLRLLTLAETWKEQGKKVHLLGASTKANVVLQHCYLDKSQIAAASDRDPRKVGRVTPGTRIPIISEEESRKLKPDVYLTVLAHFREELLAREKDFLAAGGKIIFALPDVEEVGG